MLAALNLGFLAWAQRTFFLATLALLAVSYAAVWLVAKRPGHPYVAALACAVVLFAGYKAPIFAPYVPNGITAWLTTLGFSYAALRFVDELTTARDRQQAPTFVEHVNYLLPFHMLAAGPIQRYEEFRAQPALPPPLTFSEATSAVERIVLGLFKKLVLAHLIERLFLTGFRSEGWYFVLEVQLFLPWLYLDFSSYSDIAVGVGRLLGVATPENFDRPYLARDMVEFWQRWHISLSEWIRRNVFMPVQMRLQRRERKLTPLASSAISLLLAFGLCGLWHMVSLRYAAWGLLHAVGVITANWWRTALQSRLGRAGYQAYRRRRLPRLLGIAITFEFVAWSLALVANR
jgi:D-alanyl-lipoteichoic acid acyltransferase DltB (MBOAT superfamily)